MKLQRQMSNGSWVDCGKRTEEFLVRCEEFSNQDREGVLADLAAGKTVRNDRSDWYSVCRDGEVCSVLPTREEASTAARRISQKENQYQQFESNSY